MITLAEAQADPALADQRIYMTGPLCLVLEGATAIERPIPARGFLGFWPIGDAAAVDLDAQLAGAGRRY